MFYYKINALSFSISDSKISDVDIVVLLILAEVKDNTAE